MNLTALEQHATAAAALVPDGWWNESCVIHAPAPGGGAWHPVDCTPLYLDDWERQTTIATFVGAADPVTVKALIAVARAAKTCTAGEQPCHFPPSAECALCRLDLALNSLEALDG